MDTNKEDPMTVKLVQEIHTIQSKHAYIVSQLDFMTKMCDLMAEEINRVYCGTDAGIKSPKDVIERFAIKAYEKINSEK